MDLFRRILIIGVLAASLTAAAVAQDPARPLTLREAISLALSRNPEVLLAQEQLEELKGKTTEVRADAFPRVSLQGLGLRLRDPSILNSSSFDGLPQEFRDALVPQAANLFDLGLSVKQPIYTAGKVRNAIRLAEEGQKEKEAELEAVRKHVAFKVFKAFHDLLLAAANLDVIGATYEQRKKHLELARSRFTLGVATEIDVLRSEVHVANTEPELIRAKNRVRLARSALNNLLVISIEASTQPANKLEFHPWLAPNLEEMQLQGLRERPEVIAARLRVNEYRLLVSLAQAENKLSVDMEGRWGYSTRDPKNIFDSDFTRWNVTLNFKLPFYDGGRKAGLLAQARSRVRAAEQSLSQLENNIRLEIKAAHDDLQSSAQAIAAAKLSVAQAERVLGMMQSNYQCGAATTLDVVDSQTALSVARNALISATYDYEVARARLRLAAGNPILDEEGTP
jgi:HAE1 family hydrophobic/amphiphilic exporter-1